MLHGRDPEQAVVRGLLDAARAGRGRALVVRGVAGIGKSALLAHAGAAAGGMRVLRVTGTETESELAFAGLHPLLAGVTDRIGDLPRAQADVLRAALAMAPPPDGDGRPPVGLAVLTLLAALAAERPVLCLVDDAHWLDAASAGALLFAARRLAAEPVALLFAARDVHAPPFPAAGLPELRLTGLAPADAARLLDERAADLPAAVRARVAGEAEGVPLALEEFAAAWREGRRAAHPAGGALPAHSRVLRTFADRVEALPPRTARLLLVIAAEDLGDPAAVFPAAGRLGAGVPDLEPAERRDLVRYTGDRLVFRHPLIRAAVYQGAPLGERLAVHEELAAVFAARGDVCRHAWHLAAGRTGPDERVAAALDRAAEVERTLGGYPATSAAYERAAALSPDPASRGRRLVAAATAAAEAGQRDRATSLARAALPHLADPLSRARAALVHATAAEGEGRPAEAHRVLAGAAFAVVRHDPGLAGEMLCRAVEAAWAAGDLPAAARTARRAGRLGLREPGVLARAACGLNRPEPGAIADGVRALRRLLGAPGGDGGRRATWHLLLGDHRAAHAWATDAEREARARGAPASLAEALSVLARTRLHQGLPHDALACGTEGLRVAREAGRCDVAARLAATLAHLAALAGDEERCAALAAEAVSPADGRRDVRAGCALGLLDLGLGRHAAALDRLAELLSGPDPAEALPAVPDLVEAAVRLGERRLAAGPARRHAEWARHTGQPWAVAVALRCRALLDEAHAERHWAAALNPARWEGGPPFEHLRTLLLHGEWLRRARRRSEARSALRRAAEGFERLGALPWGERARAELRAAGERPAGRERAPDPLGRLTPQELQVVRLAATGLSNREIGEQLFLSPRTVGHHLYKAYPKLGVTTRAQLARLAL